MKRKHFYSHIVDTSTISLELGNMDLTPEERVHLLSLVDSNIHHVILDLILSELSEDDKKIFLMRMAEGKHEEIWKFLKVKTNNIEEKIKKVAEILKTKLYKDIKETKGE
ncbi:MAG: hypothetical protein HYT07_01550 [Candidatus Levybacteria bacterium]|nr:hypothetical protein [Candidatus Levybacteria bacterium]